MTETIQQPAMPAKQQPKALRVLATIVTYVFHPVFMPLVMTYALYRLSPVSFAGLSVKQFNTWMFSIGFTTVFFPLFTILLLKGLGFIDSFRLNTAKERIIPLMATMIFYFWMAHVFLSVKDVPVPFIIKVLFLGNFWATIPIFLVNIFTKVSLHTCAAGSMIGILIVLMMMSTANMAIPFFIVLILAGIIGTSRMILNAHYPGDIWVGYIIGVLVQLGAYWYVN